MPSPYNLRCLGTVELRSPGGDLVRLRTRKHTALLVFLAVEARISHRRERLADLLWPGASAAEGRHSLATALSVLRGRFGAEGFEAGRDNVRFTSTDLTLDLDRLAKGDVLETEFIPALEVAPFLEDFEIDDAPEFQLWRDGQQARWLPFIRDALVRLMDRCRRTGDFRRIEGLADRMVRLDSLSEEGIRAKMEARAFSGDRLTALKIFEAWKDRLLEELGAAPSSLIEGIAIRLRRRGWERTTTIEIPPVPTDQWKSCPFIGRTVEYRVLYEAWEQTAAGNGSHVLLLGDSGIGKSTLIERLTTAAGLEGAATARVQCYEPERDIPYAALSGLVHGLLDRPGASGTPPEWLAELARAVPAVRQRFPTVPQAPETHGEAARLRLTEAVHQLLGAVAEESPVILVLDDIHLADDASVSVLHLLLRRTRQQRIMLLTAARAGELTRTPSAGRLREGQAQLGLSIVDLPPMSNEESHQLLSSLLAPEAPPPGATVRRAIVRAAAGYPMVMELLVRDWQLNGDRCLALSVDAMTAEAGNAGGTEDAYRRILERLILELDPATRNVLNLAAILGTRLNDLGMYALVDLSLAQTMTGMAQLTDRRLLRDGGQDLEFRNELIRAQAYLGIPSPLRRVLHSQVADRLLASAAEGVAIPGLEIAWHCMRSGRVDEATPYLLSGAREAMQRGALHEAELSLSTAHHLREPERSEALLLLAEVLQDQGRWGESLGALKNASIRGQPALQTLEFILATVGKWQLHQSTIKEREVALRALASIASENNNSVVRAIALRAIGGLLNDLQDLDAAREIAHQLHDTTTESIGSGVPEVAYIRAVISHRAFPDPTKMASEGEILSAIAILNDRSGASYMGASLHNVLGCIRTSAGRYESAVEPFLRAHQIASDLGNGTLAARVSCNLAMCAGRLGKHQDQLRWATRFLETPHSDCNDYIRFRAAFYAAWASALMGDSESAMRILATQDSSFPLECSTWVPQTWKLLKADVYHVLHRDNLALESANSAIEGSGGKLESIDYAGPYARWIALIGLSTNSKCEARTIVGNMVAQLDKYDLVDQAEVLSAMIWLGGQAERGVTGCESKLSELLERLPPAVSAQLARLTPNGKSVRAAGLPNPAVAPPHSRRASLAQRSDGRL